MAIWKKYKTLNTNIFRPAKNAKPSTQNLKIDLSIFTLYPLHHIFLDVKLYGKTPPQKFWDAFFIENYDFFFKNEYSGDFI